LCYGQGNATIAVDAVELFNRTVRKDWLDRAIDAGEHALRLAERISEQHAGFGRLLITAPPGVDFSQRLARLRPSKNRQSESRFRDEGVARHGLEAGASRIGREFVITGHYPDLSLIFDAHLRRPQDMARG